MSTITEQTIYIFSGPCGVGKSTLAKELADKLDKSAIVHGDNSWKCIVKDLSRPGKKD
ncbi:hypothetical protein [Mesobacillus sp.]|uniref:hypothetical protein n=1 Tax=Mesobacillus sp. TaxID=2675271 RepID=UPI0039F054B9